MPDLIVRNPRGAPVIVETEYAPARTVEQDAAGRLGRTLTGSGAVVEQCVALRVPDFLRRAPQAELDEHAAQATYEYCVLSGDSATKYVRWPSRGWLTGAVDDLASLLENASISERLVAFSLDLLEQGIEEAAAGLRAATADRPAVNADIAEVLCQEDGEQTSRMAMAIVANALTFQTMLAGAYDVRTLDALRTAGGPLPKAAVVREWDRILDINYWPIFHVAREVLLPIPDGVASSLLDRLAVVSSGLDAHGVTQSHEHLRPHVSAPDQRSEVPRHVLHVADLGRAACGTGGRTARRRLERCEGGDGPSRVRLRVRHRDTHHGRLPRDSRAPSTSGGDDAAIHRGMMEHALVAADIMPAATDLTTSMLSSTHPTKPFEQTQVHLLAYGRQETKPRHLFRAARQRHSALRGPCGDAATGRRPDGPDGREDRCRTRFFGPRPRAGHSLRHLDAASRIRVHRGLRPAGCRTGLL